YHCVRKRPELVTQGLVDPNWSGRAKRALGERRSPMSFGRVACAIQSVVAMSSMRGRRRRRALRQSAYCVVVGLAFLLVAGAVRAEPIKVAISQRGFWDSSFIEFAIREGF